VRRSLSLSLSPQMMMHLFKSCLSPVRRQEGRRLMMFSHSLPYIAPYKVQYRTKLGDRPEHPYQMVSIYLSIYFILLLNLLAFISFTTRPSVTLNQFFLMYSLYFTFQSFNDTRNNYKFKGVKYEDFVKYFNRYGCSYSRANFYDNYWCTQWSVLIFSFVFQLNKLFTYRFVWFPVFVWCLLLFHHVWLDLIDWSITEIVWESLYIL
jgi:hypothetical protein